MMSLNQVLRWIRLEQRHVRTKFSVEEDLPRLESFGDKDNYWRNQLEMYYHRAEVLGLENEVGRQALAKYVTTAVCLLQVVTVKYGDLPDPGYPSGDLRHNGY